MNVNIVFKKVKESYELRLATEEETKQNYLATMPSWETGLNKDQRPKQVRGFDDCSLYPPDYTANTIMVQGEKTCFVLNFKTLQGRMFIKGMKGYTGSYINGYTIACHGMDYDFNKCPEIIQEILNQLPSKGTLVNEGGVISTQF